MPHDPGWLVKDERYWSYVGRFVQQWAKRSAPKLAADAQDLVSSYYPSDAELLDRCESFWQLALQAGRVGDELSLETCDFAHALPASRWRDVQPGRIFLRIAFRQWQLGRADLVRRLLREHDQKRQKQRHGLGA